MTQTIAVLGSGVVGETLANGFVKHGYRVIRGSRDPQKLAAWKGGETATFDAAAQRGDVIVLAVKGTAAESIVGAIAPHLAGKLVIDTTNPIGDAPPQNGVIVYFTKANESLMERLQKLAPAARFVKSWNSVGNALMVDPKLPTKPTMFICGNDAGAKSAVTEMLAKFGWDACDVGPVEAARPVEALCQLWCAPGFLRNDWMHAFKYVTP